MAGWDTYLLYGFFIFFAIGGGALTFWLLYRARWKFQWVLIQDRKIVQRGRCRLINVGDGGEEIFFLKGIAKYKVGYGRRIGNNQIAWAVGRDGYWYNVELGDLETSLLEVGIMPVDRDMRYATASVRKLVDTRYNDKGFLEKWGTPIAIMLIIVAIAVQGIASYYTLKKQGEINVQTSNANLEAVEVSERVMKLSDNILAKIDNIIARQESGGSGIATANVPNG